MLSVLPLGVLTAQEAKNYLPKAGDFAIGIDMQPIYSFFGNMANGDSGNGLATFGGEEVLNYSNNVTIMGKYLLDNTTALRVNVGIEKEINHNFSYSLDDLKFFENPLSEQKVEDGSKQDYTAFSIAAGMEFRRGNNRIQGYCGADLVLAVYKNKYTFQYGNAVTRRPSLPTGAGCWKTSRISISMPIRQRNSCSTKSASAASARSPARHSVQKRSF